MKIKFSRAICLLVLSAMMQGGCASSSRSAGAPTVVDVFWDTYLFTNVTRLSEDREVKSWARVSPDGTKMLYCEENKQSRNAQRNIMLLRDVSVPAKTMLISDTDAYAPSWYENSTNYLFVAMEGKVGRIVRSAITGGGKTYINRNPIGTADTNPSIRNGVILCDTVISGRRQLISMRDNGLEVTILGDGYSPSWHPDEQKFVFIRDNPNGQGNAVCEMDLENIQVTQLFSEIGSRCDLPSYSSDGKYVMFQKQSLQDSSSRSGLGGVISRVIPGSSQGGNWQIFSIDSNGLSLQQLTTDNVNSFSPSRVGNSVYFISDASGYTELYRALINLE